MLEEKGTMITDNERFKNLLKEKTEKEQYRIKIWEYKWGEERRKIAERDI